MLIRENIEKVRQNLREFPVAQLIAVGKGQSLEKIRQAYQAGQRDFGENYVQELVEKAKALLLEGITDIRWHYIGHLQRNKVKTLLPYVFAVHTVDSVRVAEEISKRWLALQPKNKLPVFIQVNIDQEATKSGFSEEGLMEELETLSLLPGLDWRGLMCVPSPEGSQSGESFRRLRVLEQKCRGVTHGELSMGMSEDYERALREAGGAHRVWIRIGTGIFGSRSLPTA